MIIDYFYQIISVGIKNFIKHNSIIATWLTTFLLIFPAYDVFNKRKRLTIIISDITHSESVQTKNGESKKINWTDFTIDIINQTDLPISIFDIKINQFDKSKEKEEGEHHPNIHEINPRDYQLFSRQKDGYISRDNIFSIVVTSVEGKAFKLYPNGRVKSIVKKYWLDIKQKVTS